MNPLKLLLITVCFSFVGLGAPSLNAQTQGASVKAVKKDTSSPGWQPRRRVVLTQGEASAEKKYEWVGAVEGEAFEYQQGTTILEGWKIPYRGSVDLVPGVLIIPDWTGVGDFSKTQALDFAKMGIVVVVADIYGKGVHPQGPKECGAEAGKYKSDRDLFRARLLAGFEQIKKQPRVDPNRIAAVGYCFGGTGVLELARAGADVKGVVSFHGGLDSPTPADGKNIKAKVLVLHGADDPYVPAEGIAAMTAELNAAKVDWQMISYSGAVHSFSNPGAGSDVSKGNAYDARADARSWTHMRAFLDELFAPSAK